MPGAAAEGEQYFLKLDGITGDVLDKGIAGAIQLTEFSWGASRAAANGVEHGQGRRRKCSSLQTRRSARPRRC